ncbi:hypothetical protein TWF696_009642 [Orbilia brochopaga]|uniref:Uncharacterized protein n=1 Tax=Orbilia brochopaga TaxID=3140254 RepID=A0AAV9UEQ7_9PEZI
MEDVTRENNIEENLMALSLVDDDKVYQSDAEQDNSLSLIEYKPLDKRSEDELRKDPLFAPPFQPSKPPKTREDFQHFGDRLIKKQWDKLWQDCYEGVKARETRGGTYDPVKQKRVFDPAKGEKDSYDPIQGKEGSLEWAIHQLMECYETMKITLQEIEAKIEDIEENVLTEEKWIQTMEKYGAKLTDDEKVKVDCAEQLRHQVAMRISPELRQLEVRKGLLKRTAESHLWYIAKQDEKYKYQGDMLRGLIFARDYFAKLPLYVDDSELEGLRIRSGNNHF